MNAKKKTRILFVADDENLKDIVKACFEGWGYSVFLEDTRAADINRIIKLTPDVIIIDAHSTPKSRLEICDKVKNDLATAYVPIITIINKRHLREQLLDLKQGVDDYLVKPLDLMDLRVRIEMAIKRTQHSFYANSLTGLPGGIVIENVTKERLEGKQPFVVGHIDIDNFKSFNDKYGYQRGDRAILQTAYMLNTVVRNWGNKNDFVGHIGGDDFVVITSPDRYKVICQNFICMFDTIISFHYSPEEREKGYVVTKDRMNKVRRLPLMSVTIALVIKNNDNEFHNTIELNERIAEVKQYLKKIPGSKYMADRRILKKDDTLTLQVFSNDESLSNYYKPLGQILLEKNVISFEELDRALKVHWRRGALLGEVLKDMGVLSDHELKAALDMQVDKLDEGEKITDPYPEEEEVFLDD
jgi:DNA-binding response OmpR family regulator